MNQAGPRIFLIAVLGLSPSSWGGALAADPRAADRPAVCPQRRADEARKTYVRRLKIDCEARWSRMVDTHETGGQTHDEFVNRCAKRCDAGYASVSGGALAALLGGLAAAGGAAAGGGSGDHPASP